MQAVVMLVASSPANGNAGSAFRSALALRERGTSCELVLLQDTVLAGVASNQLPAAKVLRSAARAGCSVRVLSEDLRLRGFGEDDLMNGAGLIDYPGLVELLTAERAQVRGVF